MIGYGPLKESHVAENMKSLYHWRIRMRADDTRVYSFVYFRFI
jgi:hypothetical protein